MTTYFSLEDIQAVVNDSGFFGIPQLDEILEASVENGSLSILPETKDSRDKTRAASYEQHWTPVGTAIDFFHAVSKSAGDIVRVADIGCGSGRLALPFLMAGKVVEGFDVDPENLPDSFKKIGMTVTKLHIKRGTSLPKKFRVGICNPPFGHKDQHNFTCVLTCALKSCVRLFAIIPINKLSEAYAMAHVFQKDCLPIQEVDFMVEKTLKHHKRERHVVRVLFVAFIPAETPIGEKFVEDKAFTEVRIQLDSLGKREIRINNRLATMLVEKMVTDAEVAAVKAALNEYAQKGDFTVPKMTSKATMEELNRFERVPIVRVTSDNPIMRGILFAENSRGINPWDLEGSKRPGRVKSKLAQALEESAARCGDDEGSSESPTGLGDIKNELKKVFLKDDAKEEVERHTVNIEKMEAESARDSDTESTSTVSDVEVPTSSSASGTTQTAPLPTASDIAREIKEQELISRQVTPSTVFFTPGVETVQVEIHTSDPPPPYRSRVDLTSVGLEHGVPTEPINCPNGNTTRLINAPPAAASGRNIFPFRASNRNRRKDRP